MMLGRTEEWKTVQAMEAGSYRQHEINPRGPERDGIGQDDNNRRNGSFFYVASYLIEEGRRWPIITASPRGQCTK